MPGERVISAGRYAVAREGEARARQIAVGIANLTGKSSQICDDCEPDDQDDFFAAPSPKKGAPAPESIDFGRSVEKAAEKFNVSEKTVERSIKVVKDGAPELVQAVERGEVSVSAAADVATLTKANAPWSRRGWRIWVGVATERAMKSAILELETTGSQMTTSSDPNDESDFREAHLLSALHWLRVLSSARRQ